MLLIERRRAFIEWYHGRPFVGSALLVLAGIELFFSGQFDLGNIRVQMGMEGLQATILPLILVVLGVLIAVMPVHRVFYGIIALATAVYSLIGLNLGGFFGGMVLGVAGGLIAVSWAPRADVPVDDSRPQGDDLDESTPGRPLWKRFGAVLSRKKANADLDVVVNRRTPTVAKTAVALCLVVALGGIGAAKAPASSVGGFCIPVLMTCDATAPTPQLPSTPRPVTVPVPGVPLTPITVPNLTGPAAGSTEVPSGPGPDPDNTIFTLPAAQMTGSSITITGLHSVGPATVKLADGSTTRALRIVADDVIVNDFLLDVRKATGSTLVTTAKQMGLHGNVTIYLNSLSATLLDRSTLTLGASTPTPGRELPSTMFRVSLGLIGLTAKVNTLFPSHEAIN